MDLASNNTFCVFLDQDIFDKELNDLRKGRWERAFSEQVQDEHHNDLRATIVVRIPSLLVDLSFLSFLMPSLAD